MDTNSPLYQDATISVTADDLAALAKIAVESGKLDEIFASRLAKFKGSTVGDLTHFAALQFEHDKPFWMWLKNKALADLVPAPAPVEVPVPVCGRSEVSRPISGVKPEVCKTCTKTTEERVYAYLYDNKTWLPGKEMTVKEIGNALGLSRTSVYYAVVHSKRIVCWDDTRHTGSRPAKLYWVHSSHAAE